MDVIISGQGGAAAFVDGSHMALFFMERPDVDVRVDARYVRLAFDGCNDVERRTLRSPQEARAAAEEAWACDRGLRLLLVLLDPDTPSQECTDVAKCLSNLLDKYPAVNSHIENNLLSAEFPQELNTAAIHATTATFGLVETLVDKIITSQGAIARVRDEFDAIPDNLFAKDFGRGAFLEAAIERGCFKRLVISADSDQLVNFEILKIYGEMRNVPNSQQVVSRWTEHFRTGRIILPVVPQESLENEFSPGQREGLGAHGRQVLSNALKQQAAVVAKLRTGNIEAARRYAAELIQSQWQNSEPEHIAKSLCRLSQHAKRLGATTLQLEWAQNAAEVNPTDPWTHGQVADALFKLGRVTEARIEFDLAEATGNPLFAATGRARVCRALGQLDAARDAYVEAKARFAGYPDESFAWAGAAEVLRDMGLLEESLHEYELATDKFPSDAGVHSGRGSVLADLGRIPEAIDAYQRAIEVGDEPIVPLNGIATAHRLAGDLDRSLAQYRAIRRDYPNDPACRCGLAEVLRLQGNLEASLVQYDRIAEEFPYIHVSFSGKAEILKDLRRFEESESTYLDALKRFPHEARLLNGLAGLKRARGMYADALSLVDRVVAEFPHDVVAKLLRADLLRRLGHLGEAEAVYIDILKKRPFYQPAMNSLAAVYVIQNRFDEVVALLDKQSPKSEWYWRGIVILSTSLIKQGRIDLATSGLLSAITEVPFARERRFLKGLLASIRLSQSRFSEAVFIVETVPGEITNVIRFHALAAAQRSALAREIYRDALTTFPPQVVALCDEVARRYRVIEGEPNYSRDWIFETEREALLLEAA